MAYQAGGHELNPSQVKRIITACNFPEPEVKILLDIPPETAIERIKSRGNKTDRFEEEGLPFMRAVSKFYRLIAEDQKDKFIRIQCGGMTEDEVFSELASRLEGCLWRYR